MNISPAKLGVSLAGLTVLFGALLMLVFVVFTPAWPQELDDAWWVDRNYPSVFNDLFPIDHAQGDFIAVRAHRDRVSAELVSTHAEFSVMIENTDNPHEMRGILRDTLAPIYEQLKDLHAQYPKKTYAEIEKDMEVLVWEFPGAQCPAVAAQYKAFENITFVRPRDDDAQDEHPIIYQFHESVGGGDSEVVEYVESRAFPQWANATRKAFGDCINDSVKPTLAAPKP